RAIVVPIVVAWDAPAVRPAFEDRAFDILFSGALNEETKGVLFFADVITRCCELGFRPRVRIAGDGPQRDALEKRFVAAGVDVQFDGYVQAAELPEVYGSARLLMFPSRGDAWGLVANEAVLCGTPVLAS